MSGEEYHEMEDRLRDALEKVVLLQGERDELAQAKFDLEKQVHTNYLLSFVLSGTYIRTCVILYSSSEWFIFAYLQAQIKDEEIIELRADLRAKEVLVQPG